MSAGNPNLGIGRLALKIHKTTLSVWATKQFTQPLNFGIIVKIISFKLRLRIKIIKKYLQVPNGNDTALSWWGNKLQENFWTPYVWNWLGVSPVLSDRCEIRPSPKSFNVLPSDTVPSPGCVFPRCKVLGNCLSHPATLPRHLRYYVIKYVEN